MNQEKSELERIKKLGADEAIKELDIFLSAHPDCEEALTQRGLRHWAKGNRAAAIKDYLAAININPESKARLALKAANNILDFYNKDLLNP